MYFSMIFCNRIFKDQSGLAEVSQKFLAKQNAKFGSQENIIFREIGVLNEFFSGTPRSKQ